MITKTVTSGERSASATISEETKFVFADPWQFYHVKNLGMGNIYVSMSAGASADGDGVTPVLPGEAVCTQHYSPRNAVYITADNPTDKAFVQGSNIATSPFRVSGKGGGTVDLTPYAQKSKMFYPDNQYGGIITDNLDTLAVSGFYTAYGTATGAPNASYSWFVYHHNSNTGTATAYQRAVAYNGTLTVYERVKIGGTWGSWTAAGGGETYTTLYSGTAAANAVVTLTGSISNYKKAEILTERGSSVRDISVYNIADIAIDGSKTYIFSESVSSNNFILFSAANKVTNGTAALSLLRIRGIN